jgi:hypothetical protein
MEKIVHPVMVDKQKILNVLESFFPVVVSYRNCEQKINVLADFWMRSPTRLSRVPPDFLIDVPERKHNRCDERKSRQPKDFLVDWIKCYFKNKERDEALTCFLTFQVLILQNVYSNLLLYDWQDFINCQTGKNILDDIDFNDKEKREIMKMYNVLMFTAPDKSGAIKGKNRVKYVVGYLVKGKKGISGGTGKEGNKQGKMALLRNKMLALTPSFSTLLPKECDVVSFGSIPMPVVSAGAEFEGYHGGEGGESWEDMEGDEDDGETSREAYSGDDGDGSSEADSGVLDKLGMLDASTEKVEWTDSLLEELVDLEEQVLPLIAASAPDKYASVAIPAAVAAAIIPTVMQSATPFLSEGVAIKSKRKRSRSMEMTIGEKRRVSNKQDFTNNSNSFVEKLSNIGKNLVMDTHKITYNDKEEYFQW